MRCKACLTKTPIEALKNGVCPECYEKEQKIKYKSPTKAVLMSILPGAAHKFYLGQDRKGTAMLVTFLISCIPLFWFFLPIAIIVPVVDAYSEAKRINGLVQNG
jgi:TM2 domain-containing membrane protein YozV